MPLARASSIAVSAARAITRWPMPLSPSTSPVAAAVRSTVMVGRELMPPARSRLTYCGRRKMPWASAPVRSASHINSATLPASVAGSPVLTRASSIKPVIARAETRSALTTWFMPLSAPMPVTNAAFHFRPLHSRTDIKPSSVADLKFLERSRQAQLGTSNRKATLESIKLLVPLCFRSSYQRVPRRFTNFGSGALAAGAVLAINPWPRKPPKTSEFDMDAETAVNRARRGPRLEDDYLVRGTGRFVADAPEPGQAYAAFVRSPHACARIVSVDVTEAKGARGVVAVLTATDMDAAGVGNVGRHAPLLGRGGKKLIMPNRPALARDRVMHVGEPVAIVIAETALAAQDAAERVIVEYEEIKPVIDVRDAVKPDAPQLWPEAPGNIAVDWPGTAPDPDANAAAVEEIIRSAAHVARVAIVNQRLVVASMETRGLTASYDKAADRYTVRACSQSAGALRDNILGIMSWPKERLHVITEDGGGAFGLKTGAYPDYIA